MKRLQLFSLVAIFSLIAMVTIAMFSEAQQPIQDEGRIHVGAPTPKHFTFSERVETHGMTFTIFHDNKNDDNVVCASQDDEEKSSLSCWEEKE
jgi:hypothetical protein